MHDTSPTPPFDGIAQAQPRRPELRTVLIYQAISPPSLLAHIRTVFDVVHYYPVDGFHLDPATAPLPSAEVLASTDVLFATALPPNLVSITQAPRLAFFQSLSSGVGHITSSEFWRSIPPSHPLVHANAAGVQVTPISEHCIAVILNLWHKLNTLIIRAHEKEDWVSNASLGGFYVRELSGAVVGILGYGAVGRETARLASAFGASVHACNRAGRPSPYKGYVVPNTGDPLGVIPTRYFASSSRDSLHAFLASCDVVVNTLPSCAANCGLVGEEELRAMKGDALLINIGRGDTVDTFKLVEALLARPAEGEELDARGSLRIGGAALDVTNPEPLPRHHALFKLENTIITPHSAGLSSRYFGRGVDLLVRNVERLRDRREMLNILRSGGSKQ